MVANKLKTAMARGEMETSHHWEIGETQVFLNFQNSISNRDIHQQLQGADDIGPVRKMVERY